MRISQKVFKMIGLALLLLLSCQFIFQTIFLEKVYITSKKASVTKEIQILADTLTDIDEAKINKEIRLYAQQFEAITGIVDVSGMPIYGFDIRSAFMEMVGEEGREYTIYLSQFTDKESLKAILKPGIQVTLKGLFNEGSSWLYPSSIEVEEREWKADTSMRKANLATAAETLNATIISVPVIEVQEYQVMEPSVILQTEVEKVKEKIIKGKVKEVYIPGEEVVGTGYRESKILDEMYQFLQRAIVSGEKLVLREPIVYESTDNYVGVKNIMGVVPIVLNGNVQFLVSMTSLEQVEEAISIINKYSFVIFSIGLILSLILSYWYARKFTEPILNIKDVTTAITQLDFSKVCEVKSKDEFGELAADINQMSNTLFNTLEQLRQEMIQKEKLNEQRKQFIVDVSHELKTPLTVLQATCEGYKDKIYSDQDPVPVENMLIQINTMSELVQELLAIVRLEQEEVIEKEWFDLSASFLKVYTTCKPLAVKKGLLTQLELEESVVLGDRKKIEMVMRNLYNNAIFYTPQGEHIEVKLEVAKDKWQFSIENFGVVLAREELEKVWEPFYRVDQSRNKALGGTGLGLYIVRKVLESHKADYGIESHKNSVRVWFRLEIAEIE